MVFLVAKNSWIVISMGFQIISKPLGVSSSTIIILDPFQILFKRVSIWVPVHLVPCTKRTIDLCWRILLRTKFYVWRGYWCLWYSRRSISLGKCRKNFVIWAYFLDSTILVPRVFVLSRSYFPPRFLKSFMYFLKYFGWELCIPCSLFALALWREYVSSLIFLGYMELKACFLHASSRSCISNSPISKSLMSSSIFISNPKEEGVGVVSCVATSMGWLTSRFYLSFSFEKGCMIRSCRADGSGGTSSCWFFEERRSSSDSSISLYGWDLKASNLLLVAIFIALITGFLWFRHFLVGSFLNPSLLVSSCGAVGRGQLRRYYFYRFPCSWHLLHLKGTWS